MTRVYIDMVGDLFHVGHLNIIKTAKNLGDHLTVGVHSDAEVASYKRLPIINETDRYEIIESCKFVNSIIRCAPLIITEEFIIKHNIDIVAHGDDISPHFQDHHRVPIELGIMQYIPYTKGVSTTDIIYKIINR